MNVDYGFNNKITLTSPSSNEVLKYDATNTKWINANANLSEMADCTIKTPTNNQLLQYNTSSGKWINATVSSSTALSSLTDCGIDTPNLATKPILYYDSTSSKWKNTDSLQDNILFIKDDGDVTKQ